VGYSLGVDLGTTFVAAAIAHGPRVEMFTLGDRTVVMPAAVYARDDGTLVTGEAANRRAVSNPERVGREFKRRLGDPTPVMLGGTPHAVTSLLAALLADAVSRVTATEGAPPDHMVLTHPANWGPYRRELFEEVPQLAGVPQARMVTEPEAAAAHYAFARHLANGDTVAVYDLGGGTFDATVLRKRGSDTSTGGIDILGTPEGIERLGGVDFDDAILAHINYSSGGALSELDLSNPQTSITLARLRQDCILAKEALSVDTEATIAVFLPNRHFDVRLTRSEFEDMIRAQIESTIGALTRTLRSANVEPADLSAVLLVGGSSRIPLVDRMITEALDRPTLVDAHPKYAVALGAATLATELAGAGDAAGSAVAAPPPPPRPPAAARVPDRAQDNGAATHAAMAAPFTAGGMPTRPQSAAPPADRQGDDVQFSVYRPAQIAPLQWSGLWVYVHRSAPYVEPTTGRTIDPDQEVEDDAIRRLPPGQRYGRFIADSEGYIPHLGELTVQPWLSEGHIDPPHRTLVWRGKMEWASFQISAPASPSSSRIRGGVRFFHGPLLVGEAKFKIDVGTTVSSGSDGIRTDQVKRYRRIFVSYSHQDYPIVEAVKEYNLTGDEYLIDRLSLRPGERWEQRLAQLINQSDIFQLFWSRNAMTSSHVRLEWEHALSLARPGFICPVYWEDPRPTDPQRRLPPPALDQLHWAKLPRSRIPNDKRGPNRPPDTNLPDLRATPHDAAVGTLATAADGPVDLHTDALHAQADAATRIAPVDMPAPRERPTAPPPKLAYADQLASTSNGSSRGDRWPAAPDPGGNGAGVAPPVEPFHSDGPPFPAPPPRPGRRRRLVPAAVLVLLLLFISPTVYLTLRSATPQAPDVSAHPSGVVQPPPAERPAGEPIQVAASVPIPAIGGEVPVGQTPGFVAIAPDGKFAYIANRDAGVITVVDTAIDKVVATIPIPNGPPQYLAFAPDGTRLYISVFNDPDHSINGVAVLDTATNTVLTTIKVGSRPYALAVKPDGSQIYVPNHDSGTVSVIDTKTNTLVTDIRVKPNPHWVAFSPDGKFAYTANSESNLISVIDTASRAVVAEIPVQQSPHSVAVHPAAPLVANTNYDSNSVTVIDTNTEKVIATVPVGVHPQDVTWAPDGRHLYVTNVDSDTMTVIATDGYRVTATIPTGEAPTSVAVLPDGTKGYVTNLNDGTLTVIDLTN